MDKYKIMNKNLKILLFGLAGLLFSLLIIIPSYELIKVKRAKLAEYQKYFDEVKNAPIVLNQTVRTTTVTTGQNNNDFVGIGVIFRIIDKVVVISEVIDNSPAHKAGIEIGDRVIMIDGKYTHGLSVNDVSGALQGESGTKVILNIYRDSFGNKSRNVTIVRDIIDNSERREYFLFMDAGEGGEDLGNNYRKFRDKIYYWDDGGGQAVPDMVAINANTESFVTLENKNCTWDKSKAKFNPCRNYARDNSKVFYDYFEIKGADPETFQILKGAFAKDKNHVFYDTQKIEGMDSDTFQTLGSGQYGKDKNIVVYTDRKIANADPQTFQVLHEKYCLAYANALARDKYSYYARDSKITKEKYFENLKSDNTLSERIKETCN